MTTRVEELEATIERLKRERDLAVVHDKQPYPTAEAYEKVCAALHKTKDDRDAALRRVGEAEALLRRLSEWDHMDTAGDGPFWRREIAAFLAGSTP